MVSFGVSCQRALLQYYHDFRPEPAHPGVDTFFLAVDGYPMTTTALQLVIKRLAKSSGVNRLYPHLLRHTYATLFLINGGRRIPAAAESGAHHPGDGKALRSSGQSDGGGPEPEFFAPGPAGCKRGQKIQAQL